MPRVLLLALLAAAPSFAQDAPVPAKEAAARMTVPEGFKVTLFAGEPDLVQPIAFAFDDRERLWVAECYSYPNWQTDGKPGHDRILIFDDPDGAGHFKTRKVFADNLSNLSGIEIGFGGVWACASPNLLFIPVRDGEDKPAGPPQVVLDGWSLEAKHNVFNRLTWAPMDGCMGATASWRPRWSVSPARRTSSGPHSTAACGAITRRARRSRRWPTAPPTPGAWTGTSTASCSSPTA